MLEPASTPVVVLPWRDEYALGVEAIDLQHHYFLNLINRFIRQLAVIDRAFQQRLFNELDAYARFHFISEENMMFRAGFPNYADHKRLHDELLEELNIRQALFLRQQTSAHEVIDFLQHWFLHHTLHEDHHFAAYLRTLPQPIVGLPDLLTTS